MIHTVSGSNFHGPYSIKLRGPADGFILSDRQMSKVHDTLCGIGSCVCGGSLRYGDGPDWCGGARIARANVAVPYGTNPWPLALIPAGSPGTILDRDDPEWELLAEVVVA